MRLALYQPDIPQNLGAAIRLAACLGVPLEVIEPCGFPLTARALQRTALDYGAASEIDRVVSFTEFLARPARREGRLVLVETDGATGLYDFSFAAGDTLILGQESAGSSAALYAAADAVVRIPMAAGMRSLNVVVAGAIALAEALRQTGGYRDLA